MTDKGKGLAKILIEARKKAGKTQKEISDIIRVTVQTVSRWESGDSLPPSSRLPALAEAYGIEFFKLIQRLSFEVPIQIPDDGWGEGYIVKALEQLADEARQGEGPFILHSFSTRGFLSGKDSGVARAVVECALAGIDTVYFCLASGFPSRTDIPEPKQAEESVRARLKDAIDDMNLVGKTVDRSFVYEHIIAVTSIEMESANEASRIYGCLVKPLVVVRKVVQSGTTEADQGILEQNKKLLWNHIIPHQFDIHDLWLHIEEQKEGSIGAYWRRVHLSDSFRLLYSMALNQINRSQYEIGYLLRSDSHKTL